MLLAARLTARTPSTFTISVNDYGFELQSPTAFSPAEQELREGLSASGLLEDIMLAINAGEITKRRFRDIARIAGLVFEGYPGHAKSAKQVQASSSLIFDVLQNHDSENQLLHQARREVLEAQLEFKRIESTLMRLAKRNWIYLKPVRLTPLSFPLWAETLQAQTISSESFQSRVNRMLGQLETAASDSLGKPGTR